MIKPRNQVDGPRVLGFLNAFIKTEAIAKGAESSTL